VTAPTCCGEHAPGVTGEPLAVACQLYPNSPTHWRTDRTDLPTRPLTDDSAGPEPEPAGPLPAAVSADPLDHPPVVDGRALW
jgi:hypothetical protein